MAACQDIRPNTITIRALIGRFLEWNKNHRSEGTYEWYAGHLGSFGDYVVAKLKVGDLKPCYVTRWIKQEYKGTSDNYRHWAIRSIQWDPAAALSARSADVSIFSAAITGAAAAIAQMHAVTPVMIVFMVTHTP